MNKVEFSRLWTTSWLRAAITTLGVGTFLAVLAPYDSGAIGWPGIWFYWTGLIGFGGIIGFGTGHWLPRLMPNLPGWTVYVAAILVVSGPVSVAVLALGTDFFSRPSSLIQIAATYGLVVVITGFVTAVSWTLEKVSSSKKVPDSRPTASPALIDKLPHGLRKATLLSMTAEDHYLRVRTHAGDALILMRLSDAVAACAGLDGARTHRSWWVARDAVTSARKGDSRGTLILSDGTEAPVSRTYYPALRDAGWF